MTERLVWRRAVESSRLPNGVKLTLLKHAERGPGHWHDEEHNQHAYPRGNLARGRGTDQSTIRRHYRRAEATGYLVQHERGRAYPGRQAVFHYATPGDPWPCDLCEMGGKKGGEMGGKKGGEMGGRAYPHSASQNASPSSNPYNQEMADHNDPTATRPGSQRFSDPIAAATPPPNLSPETGSGTYSTTEGVHSALSVLAMRCLVCGGPLNSPLDRHEQICVKCDAVLARAEPRVMPA